MKHWKLDIIGYWVIGAGCLIEKSLELSPSLSNHKWFQENFDHASIYQSTKFGGLMSCGSKDIFKMHPISCTNTYHDVTDLVNHEMTGNTKTWISRERTITFL